MADRWIGVLTLLNIALLLAIATCIRTKIKIIRQFLIPIPIIAGFLGLALSSQGLGIMKFDSLLLENTVYHLMAVGFISLSLLNNKGSNKKEVFNTGIFIVLNYVMQAIVGFSVIMLLLYTIIPNIFPSIGLLLPLGFGQGPGYAFSIGSSWEKFGLVNGGNLGLSISTIGFIWGSIGGVIILNLFFGKKMRKLKSTMTDSLNESMVTLVSVKNHDLLDILTMQVMIVALIYFGAYLVIITLNYLLTPLGGIASTIADLFWGFHFIFGMLIANFVKPLLHNELKIKFKSIELNDYLLRRMGGLCFDIMITASIAAISVNLVKAFALPLILMTVIGGIVTLIFCLSMSKLLYNEHQTEYGLGMFSMMTGTIATSLPLLREVDPKLQNGVAENLVFGSSVAVPFGFPLTIILNIPIQGYLTGKTSFYWVTFAILVGYFVALLGVLYATNHARIKKLLFSTVKTE